MGSPLKRAQLPIQLSPPKYLSDALKASSNIAEQELRTMDTDGIIENAEVVGYNTLIQMAQKMDDIGEAIPVLRQNLEEEESMSCWLKANSLPVLPSCGLK